MAANAALSVMRKSFEFPVWFTQSVFKQWYPGHMAKGINLFIFYEVICGSNPMTK